MQAAAFFPPGLDPLLDGGKGDKDPMITPEVPRRGPVWQPILHDQPDGEGNHPVRVMTPGGGPQRTGRR